MADNVADNAQAGPVKPSMIGFVIILLVATLIAGGAGFLTGGVLLGTGEESADPKTEEPAAADFKGDAKSDENAADTSEVTMAASDVVSGIIVDLEPVVTNLASPANKWVRLEASIQVVEDYKGNKDELAKLVAEDFLAFLRVISLRHIEGAAGLSHFREDIEQRASIRSSGAVTRVYVKMLVVE